MYRIDKDIPVPRAAAGQTIYPLRSLEVGDSFLVPAAEVKECTRCSCRVGSKRLGIKIATRKQPDGGLRCWRVE